jgi:Ner family transcriptional regulator
MNVSIIMAMDTQKGTAPTDWHPADVKAALEKRGLSLARLATAHGYRHFQRVLTTHWWAAEQIVARALECPPDEIWPSRYQQPRDRAQKRTTKITLTESGDIKVAPRARKRRSGA